MASPGMALARSGHTVRLRRAPLDDTEPSRDVLEDAVPWARKYVPYAQLSAVVYRRSGSSVTPPSGWTLMEKLDHASGLYYEVWDSPKSRQELVIAFRGVDEPRDWWTSLRFLTRHLPVHLDQYPVARDQISGIVSRAQQRWGDTPFRIVTTGHALGGGLAQHAAYSRQDIKAVFAFDSSPSTGFRDLAPAVRAIHSRGLHIERIYEKGELLAYLRGPFLRFLPLDRADPAIVEVRFSLSTGASIAPHAMEDFALRLEMLAAR